MSAFLEEYGKVIVIILVIAALIVVATVFKKNGQEHVSKSFFSFEITADDSTDKAVNAVETAIEENQ